jgi:hypothetical protein
MALEELYFSVVLFGLCSRLECAKIAALPGLGVQLSRVEAVLRQIFSLRIIVHLPNGKVQVCCQ